jgi:hypothetical protein
MPLLYDAIAISSGVRLAIAGPELAGIPTALPEASARVCHSPTPAASKTSAPMFRFMLLLLLH